MSLEGMPRQEARPVFEIEHNKVQTLAAQIIYERTHPGATEATHSDIMMDWVVNHAAKWRDYLDAHPGEKIVLTEENIEHLCDAVFPDVGPTVH
jgi:hypothetical protein